MTDPITASIVVILGRYAIDKGAELAKEVGPKAAEKAGELLKTALDHLRRKPKGEVVADGFEEDPSTYEKPVEKELASAAEADPDFAAQLQALLAEYEEAARAHAAARGTRYEASLKGSGAIAQGPGATAVGERGVHVGGDVGGSIVTGDRNVVDRDRAQSSRSDATRQAGSALAGELAGLREQIAFHFNDEELRDLCHDMEINYEFLAGENLSGKVRELVLYCQRHNRLDDLLGHCRRLRPEADWSLDQI